MSDGPVQVVDMDCGCPEKHKEFTKVSRLTYHPNHGMRDHFLHFICGLCGKKMDTIKMVHEASLDRKRKELDELESEIRQENLHAPK